MAETKAHKRVKRRVAGKKGKPEKKLKYGGRLDAGTRTKAFEYERSGDPARLARAIRKLKRSRKPHQILAVSRKRDVLKAIKIARKLRAKNITIKHGKTYRKP